MANILMAFSIPMTLLIGVLIWVYFMEKDTRKTKKKKK